MQACEHCGTPFMPRRVEERFCCRGCEFVAAMIRGQGLDRFYDLQGGGTTPPVRSRPFETHDFSWLPATAGTAPCSGGVGEFDCSVEGISCIGCVWLIERLFLRVPGAIRAVGNPANGRLHLEWQRDSACDLPGFARDLAQFGYVMAPATKGGEGRASAELSGRLGLCGAFALNAMGFSLPTYLGMPADFQFAGLFRLIAFASATLAMLVGGGYFAGRAWRALRHGTLHIDLPIALGLIAAYLGSLAGWIAGEERLLYFDFVATFAFLMLLGRRVQTAAVSRNRQRLVRRSPLPEEVRAQQGLLPLAEIAAGTRFELEPGRALPVAAVLAAGVAEVSLEWIHGEADPVLLKPGARIPAGAILLGREAVSVTADEAWGDSLIHQLVAGRDTDRGSPRFQRLLRVYLVAVLIFGVAVFAFWYLQGDWRSGLQAMISIFVVSCPCALGVAVPLADEWAATRLARAGAFARHASLWPRLARVKHIIFDKTGTLTLERPVLDNPAAVESLDTSSALALARLTRGSLHPVSRSLLEALGVRGQRLLEAIGPVQVHEVPGEGVHCSAEDGTWFLGKGQSGTELRHDGALVASFTLSDSLRPGVADAVNLLRSRGLSIHILSGDTPAKVARLATALHLPAENAAGALSPQQKAARVKELDRQDTLYLGDGANDSLAFDAAFVTGTPVVDRSLLESKADFYALGSGVNYLAELFAAADGRARGVRRAFLFALVYNIAVVTMAAGAWMNPLLAAVLMPLSSVVSILLAATGARTCGIATSKKHHHGLHPTRSDVRILAEAGVDAVRSHAA
ncbi:heavy metal translocating P-type ATPase metal-binding domain-containing protein [Luteolibacter arcticus]|uniref:Heavy metal translocating P-type ATPase metal-binding domain-containing protein n=1 Tax=Luteolibacter arcticus TaxID=1581411 RepID=A0ABT3GIP5_9BACT|nr:heavy metal translocating P-type ATPase metal-binding domain-containing protein [Luteolibacter arcticus]MCW1923369.1 heavy metal translocating P-type ATPase metal-binding domain-containing protein [Luteolibacter arcticus]